MAIWSLLNYHNLSYYKNFKKDNKFILKKFIIRKKTAGLIIMQEIYHDVVGQNLIG